jgi:hypothetical protein
MLSELASTTVLGFPLIMYGGVFTFLIVAGAFLIPQLNEHRKVKIPIKYHVWLARFAVLFAAFHGLLGLSTRFGW